MTKQHKNTGPDRTDSNTQLTSLQRRDVMKAVSGAIMTSSVLADAGAAKTTFCGTDSCTVVVKPPKDVYALNDVRTVVEFDQEYLDTKMEEGFDTLGIKSRSCTDSSDDSWDCDYVSLDSCTNSYSIPETCNDMSHPELLKCEDESYVIEQGGECIPIEPLSGGDIVDLFGFTPEEPRQTNLPAPLEAPQKSRLFLYEGPNGLSLVIVHGGGDNEEGGAATFRISGLPSDGEFVVLADRYEGTEDEFNISDREAVLNWSWGGTNDGGVFRGLGAAFCIEIKAAWNDEANLEPYGSGTVKKWQVLTGSLDDPKVVDLNMDEAITIGLGSCGGDTLSVTSDQQTEQQDQKTGENKEEDEDEENQEGYAVCHRPPGNPDNSRTIHVGSESALKAHLDHGDSRGPCPGDE